MTDAIAKLKEAILDGRLKRVLVAPDVWDKLRELAESGDEWAAAAAFGWPCSGVELLIHSSIEPGHVFFEVTP